MTHDLAAALLRDVERYPTFNGRFMYEDAVLAALSRALDPALAERAGEVLSRLRKADEYEPLGHDGWEAADMITALLAQNAALRAEAQEMGAGMVTLSHELSMERARAEAAEAKVEKLRGKIRDWEARIDACEWSTNSSLTEDIRAEMRAAITEERHG